MPFIRTWQEVSYRAYSYYRAIYYFHTIPPLHTSRAPCEINCGTCFCIVYTYSLIMRLLYTQKKPACGGQSFGLQHHMQANQL